MKDEKFMLKSNEILRVTPTGEFVWHPDADQMIVDGDFSNAPAMFYILLALRQTMKEKK